MGRPPPPQQARAVATRAAIVAAAVHVLAHRGRSGASTSAIARAAGVSQGALFRHFPTKAQLLAAATERILAELFDEFSAALPGALAEGDLLRGALGALWAIYCDPRLAGVFELYLAARTDPALAEELQPVVGAHVARELDIARMLFPDAVSRSDFEPMVMGLLSTIQGAAVAAAVVPTDVAQPAGRPAELLFIEALVRAQLGTPSWVEVP